MGLTDPEIAEALDFKYSRGKFSKDIIKEESSTKDNIEFELHELFEKEEVERMSFQISFHFIESSDLILRNLKLF